LLLEVFCFYFKIKSEKNFLLDILATRGRRGRDRMVVGFTTTSAIIAYRH